jgi:hypothetical protein
MAQELASFRSSIAADEPLPAGQNTLSRENSLCGDQDEFMAGRIIESQSLSSFQKSGR